MKVASQQPLRADVQARSEDCPDPRSHFHFLLRTAIPDRWQCTGQTVHFPGSDNLHRHCHFVRHVHSVARRTPLSPDNRRSQLHPAFRCRSQAPVHSSIPARSVLPPSSSAQSLFAPAGYNRHGILRSDLPDSCRPPAPFQEIRQHLIYPLLLLE